VFLLLILPLAAAGVGGTNVVVLLVLWLLLHFCVVAAD